MKEKLRILASLIIFLFLLPYVLTVFMQGTTFAGGKIDEAATETFADTSDEQEQTEKEQLVLILAKQINVNSEKEAIKAQAVIVRANYTYAVENNMEVDEGLLVSEMMQLFGKNNFQSCYQLLGECLDETKGVRVGYQGEDVPLPYHAVSAGRTRDGVASGDGQQFPYLVGVESSMDIPSENYLKVVYFEKTEFLAQLEQIFPQVTFTENDIPSQLSIDGRDEGDYVSTVTAGGVTVTGEEFKNRLGLASSCFSIAEADGKIRIVTKGLGHGYGLSQYGANEMAEEGKTYIDILKYYFPNVEITE